MAGRLSKWFSLVDDIEELSDSGFLSLVIPISELKMRSNTKDKILSLFTTPLFHQRVNNDGRMEKIEKFYQKAQAITRAHSWSTPNPLTFMTWPGS